MGERYWRAAEPKPAYDVVIVGAGGHGLATAYYLAANHGITDVCVVEKGWLGGGNMARNTTIIRSNYLWDESAAIYEHSLRLWEALEETSSFDMQFSQRGVLNLAHDLGDVRDRAFVASRRTGSTGSTREWLDADGGEDVLPDRRTSRPTCATPCSAPPCSGAAGSRATTGWRGATRAARTELGVDIVEHAEVTGFVRGAGRRGGRASRPRAADPRARRSPSPPPGTRACSPSMVGLRLPVQSHPLQALVSALVRAGARTAS